MGNASDPLLGRISAIDHSLRIEASVRAYLQLFECLPPSSVVIWLTPYDSSKVPWQRPLVRACRHAMLRLRAQGLFQRVLFIDTWHLTSLHGAPISWDGNHRTTTFQTLVWTLVRFAFLQLRAPS